MMQNRQGLDCSTEPGARAYLIGVAVDHPDQATMALSPIPDNQACEQQPSVHMKDGAGGGTEQATTFTGICMAQYR